MACTTGRRIAIWALAFGLVAVSSGAVSAGAATTETSSISIGISGNTTVSVGDQVNISGFLTLSDDPGPVGATVHIVRTNPDQTQTQLPDQQTIPGGEYVLADRPPVRGIYTYTATYDGDAVHSGSTATSQPLTAIGLVDSLTLHASALAIRNHASVTVTARLGDGASSGTISIWRTPFGRSKRLVQTGAVDVTGRFAVRLPLARTNTFSATFSGDETHVPSTSATLRVAVKVRITGAMVGGYARSGVYRLYHYHSSCPARHARCVLYHTTVYPNHHAQCVYFRLEALLGRRWRMLGTTGCVRLGTASKARIRIIYNASVRGVRFRINSVFKGDRANDAAGAAWSYFKVTT
jgi:hypothetical protein